MEGIIVVGHGSRSKEAYTEFMKTLEGFKGKLGGNQEVAGCFMELAEPDIKTKVAEMVNKGITKIKVIPYFLFTGIHIKEDIPEILRGLKREYPSLTLTMAGSIGSHEGIIGILLERAKGETICI